MHNIQLSDEDLKYFKLFREHQEGIELLLGANQLGVNIFKLRSAKVQLSISPESIITDIDFNQKAYSAKGRKYRL